mmetsp:Transcript_46168/g.142333  ORF Transcript_46168/g.142333 Transcript_46168/m.142333 type:complete len:206 (-) Transcript_46168:662-1279(-)
MIMILSRAAKSSFAVGWESNVEDRSAASSRPSKMARGWPQHAKHNCISRGCSRTAASNLCPRCCHTVMSNGVSGNTLSARPHRRAAFAKRVCRRCVNMNINRPRAASISLIRHSMRNRDASSPNVPISSTITTSTPSSPSPSTPRTSWTAWRKLSTLFSPPHWRSSKWPNAALARASRDAKLAVAEPSRNRSKSSYVVPPPLNVM